MKKKIIYQQGKNPNSRNGSIFKKGHKINVVENILEKLKEKMKESRLKRKKNLGYLNSIETRKKMSENHKPKFHTETTKKKIRIARLKQKLPTIDTSIERKFERWLIEK